ncbi:MAG: tetratricopeptide repeat protein [Alphaproteobacteria bacterium]|nr:tetratricopeptide repeat protein [Alphaproteobacteria bacterium]
MLRASYIIALLSGIGFFNSCTGNFINHPKEPHYAYIKEEDSVYGSYLAGRIAHIRQDYSSAAMYYVKTMEKGMVNDDLLGKTYIILASEGNIDQAIKYANLARQNGDENNFIDVIRAVHAFKHKNYRLSRSYLQKIDEKAYNNLITPLFNAWSYVGENDYVKAKAEMEKISFADELKTVYNLHSGLIAEYFNEPKTARKYYETIINNQADDMSFRALQLISNFYVRQNQKDKAIALVSKYYQSNQMKELLISLREKVKEEKPSVAPIVKNPDTGISEVFLEIALLFKSVPIGYEYAQMYMAISQYFNKNNDIAKMALANLCEERMMYQEANKYYDTINKKSEMFFSAQIQKANNLSYEKKYDEAVKVLKRLSRENPNNFQILFNLGDILRVSNHQDDAIKYYNEAISTIFYESERYWQVYYALAVSYDKNNEWSKAEQNLEKALKLSNRHPQVLNYLGYSWLKNNTNVDKAVSYILEAYEKEPNDGVIMDSLGWVYFKTGDYKNAILYLEKASELNPQNAIISDHLGDAYWFGGRKNEAVFLWKQALSQKDEEKELNIKNVKNKIENGLKNTSALTIKDENIKQSLHSLNDITE